MKKKFGQNFLTDKNLLKKIVVEANIKNKNVIEIGPGLGALTNFLVMDAKKVIAYEIDKDLKPALDEIKNNNNNFDYLFEDILKVDLDLKEEHHVVANIPYNITSPIIFKLIEEPLIKTATLMVQKEVCERIVASPNSKSYNALSVIVQYYMDVTKLMNVSKKLFTPIPKVDSAVFKMTRKDKVLKTNEEQLFIRIVKGSFHQKRKTISNNLSFEFKVEKALINEFLGDLGIDSLSRAETISVEKFILMSQKWPFL